MAPLARTAKDCTGKKGGDELEGGGYLKQELSMGITVHPLSSTSSKSKASESSQGPQLCLSTLTEAGPSLLPKHALPWTLCILRNALCISLL